MSAFEGSWRKQNSKFLTINDAQRFIEDDFFSSIEQKLQGENCSVEQTEMVLGTFFISSLIKLYNAVMIQSLFQKNLRGLAKKLKEEPLVNNSEGIKKGLEYISKIFNGKTDAKKLEGKILEEFITIFQSLELNNPQAIINLLTLFFLKPFPFEIRENAGFLIKNPHLISKDIDASENLIVKNLQIIKSAFDTATMALQTIKDQRKIEIFDGEISSEFKQKIKIVVRLEKVKEIHDEFEEIFQKKIIENLNVILYQYYIFACSNKPRGKSLDIFSAVQQFMQSTNELLQNEAFKAKLKKARSLRATVLSVPKSPLFTVEISDKEKVYKVHRVELFKNRESLAALLNANPLIKSLLLSQIPIAVTLQILRLDNDFKDVSTVMWFEPVLGIIGFACGVYALRNPKKLVNVLVRILEALSSSSVVLSKCLGIAILVHTQLFPEEAESGGIDMERFLKVIASGPITIALFFWLYNSLSPDFKEKHLCRKLRFTCDLFNHFAIYFGLNQIISIDIVRIINKMETVDFSSVSARISFEILPAIPAAFFAYARVAPIGVCTKNNIYVISERVNTAVLYGFTVFLLGNLGADLVLAENLPIEQTNFRRVFFPALLFASIAVMRHFANDFRKMYSGNPEIIIQQIIKEDGLQQPFLRADRSPAQIDSDDESNNSVCLDEKQVERLRAELSPAEESSKGKNLNGKMQLMLYNVFRQKKDLSINQRAKSSACCSCAIL